MRLVAVAMAVAGGAIMGLALALAGMAGRMAIVHRRRWAR